jgi:hypothetical protein
MQNSILLSDAQVRPAGISVEEGIKTLKCAIKREAKRLMATKSETFSCLCDESVTYGEVAVTMLGIAAFVAVMFVGGFLFGGEVM